MSQQLIPMREPSGLLTRRRDDGKRFVVRADVRSVDCAKHIDVGEPIATVDRLKRPLNRLNGWQRAWVLAAAIWLIPVTFFGVRTAGDYNYIWHHYYTTGIGTSQLILEQEFKAEAPKLGRMVYDLGLLLYNAKSYATGGWSHELLAPIEYEPAMWVGAFSLWLAPVITLYLLGLGVAWVTDGFRHGPR